MSLLITALLSFSVILIVITAMAIGVINGRTAIRGSCGGLGGRGCELCSGGGERRSNESRGESQCR